MGYGNKNVCVVFGASVLFAQQSLQSTEAECFLDLGLKSKLYIDIAKMMLAWATF